MSMMLTTISRDVAHKFFRFLNEREVVYVIIGDPIVFMDRGKDWDMFVENYPKFLSALREFCALENIFIVNYYSHATGTKFYLGVPTKTGKRKIISGPDVLFFSTGQIKGDVGLSINTLLRSRRLDESGFFVPSPEKAFIFFLVKKIDKENLGSRHVEYLSNLFMEDTEGIRQAVNELWPSDYANRLIEAAESGCWDPVMSIKRDLRIQLRKKSSFCGRRVIWFVKRLFSRSISPSGLHIAFLGPDGSGKTSIMKIALPLLARVFFSTTYIHFRFFPGRNKKESRSVNDPHGQVSWSLPVSVAKIFYYWFDYFVGWLLVVWPKRVRSQLIIFNRYYHDILVDPKRYRYGGPIWLARWVGKLIPKPDIWILLDAPPEVLQERKQEVPFEETVRQRKEYLKLVKGMENGIVIDASKSLDEVVGDVNRAIVDFMAQRTEKRFG